MSRLLDVCRGRIVCAGAEGLRDCVAAILQSPQARVLRVRNSLHPPGAAARRDDPAAATGFRVCAAAEHRD